MFYAGSLFVDHMRMTTRTSSPGCAKGAQDYAHGVAQPCFREKGMVGAVMEKKNPTQSFPQLALLKDVWSVCASAQLNQSSHLPLTMWRMGSTL